MKHRILQAGFYLGIFVSVASGVVLQIQRITAARAKSVQSFYHLEQSQGKAVQVHPVKRQTIGFETMITLERQGARQGVAWVDHPTRQRLRRAKGLAVFSEADEVAGSIRALAAQPDPLTGLYRVQVRTHKPLPASTGWFAATAYTLSKKAIIALPTTAVATAGHVWVVEGAQAMPVVVKTGLSDGKMTEIKKGLKAGQLVIVSQQGLLRKGQKVRYQLEDGAR